ncbi:sec-independent protein translocase protein TatB [Rhodothalassium salexigens DSM 2132]|uniref:Sec-independent protein translocase protein TatB n=1 Tax=Rhodothalassium salexigens DSM 2132 TaxID=1188247 RepID=A0A4R2PRI9_RHOSA|nr:Sec-independent protein translocase protein TatB [Rhodothalassium salexigens]MBB4210339.1 sec-independent protein translocase protein TatB [Rhodothalassium salexigens DSM 2132]MBK1638880.1 twin-arginine translocase subunit TatB [Rhodothalassium salexigens DSM 2132]TCP38503.1 sec-independent protein translocase protein TatB [Rhodothalassium salexigens DSM 2132]
MFDLHWTELILVMIVTLLVVGPKDLPKVMRTVGALMHKLRSFAGEFQSGLDQIAREAELDELKRQAQALQNNRIDDPATQARATEQRKDLPRGPQTSAAPAAPATPGIATPDGGYDPTSGAPQPAAATPGETWPDGSGDAAPIRDTEATGDAETAPMTEPAPKKGPEAGPGTGAETPAAADRAGEGR